MFELFQKAVQKQFKTMETAPLFKVKLEKDELWELYLSSYPDGSNPIFRERSEHDCQSCKKFIRDIGGVVQIDKDYNLISIWDCKVDEPNYQIVANKMSEYVKQKHIDNRFFHYEYLVGCKANQEQLDSGKIITWEHFNVTIPDIHFIKKTNIGGKLSQFKSSHEVFYRSLSEITIDSIETVLELIDQNSLYRGEEHKFAVESFSKIKKQFDKIDENKKDVFCWLNGQNITMSIRTIRNTVIGTLLVDLSEGKDLEYSVKSFENKVAPTNYKRPTALITKSMIDKAKQKIEELGYTSALQRRFANIEDITINNILFANRETKKEMDVFDELSANVSDDSSKYLKKVEEININKFISDILPKANTIEIMVQNNHQSNLVSLIAPVDPLSKNMFKWHNNFSWSYNGNVTDSIKERVKKAGGNVSGDLRCSLSWFNYDDLDLHMIEPDGFHIKFSCKKSNSGFLDVDMNAGDPKSKTPVENICYPNRRQMKEGIYKLIVHNYRKRENNNIGFEVEIEFDDEIHTFEYSKSVRDSETITVSKIQYSHKNGFKIIESLPSTIRSKEIWGITTKINFKMFL